MILPAHSYKNLFHFPFLLSGVFLLLFFPKEAFAGYLGSGTCSPSGPTCETFPRGDPRFSDCTTFGGQSENNICYQVPWRFDYAAYCQICSVGFGTGCDYDYTYQVQTCNSEDRCYDPSIGNVPLQTGGGGASGYDAAGQVLPGRCNASSFDGSNPESACVAGFDVYKQCCTPPSPGFLPTTACSNGVCPWGFKTSAGDTTCDAPAPPPPPRYSCSGSSCVVDSNGPYTTSNCDGLCGTCIPGEYSTPCTSTPCGGDYCTRLVYQCLSDGSDWELKYSDCPDYDVCGTCGAGGGGGCNYNGIEDNGETGVDCGGGFCPDCPGSIPNTGSADFDVRLSVRNLTQGGSWTYGPLTANPGDTLEYQIWVQNWSGPSVDWIWYYDNFFIAYGTSNSKWDMIRGDYTPGWSSLDFSATLLKSGESEGRGVNEYADWTDYGGLCVPCVATFNFGVRIRDIFSAPFGERAYIYFNTTLVQGSPQSYNSCVSTKNTSGTAGIPSGDPSWTEMPCEWWFPSNIVIVSPPVSPPPPQCAAGGSTDQANRLLGEYYNETLTGGNFANANYRVQRLDPGGSGWLANYFQVDWGGGQPAPGVNADDFKVRWTGWFNASLGSGNYYFWTEADDGTRLWVGTTPGNPGDVLSQSYGWGSPIISDWNLGGWSNCVSPDSVMGGPVNLTGGQWYPIKLEYFEGPAAAAARIKYSRTNNCATSQIIPYTSFRSCTATQTTLGTIGGAVYQNTDGVCTGSTAAPAGWSVTCSPDGTAANISGNNYQCRNASGNTNLSYGPYTLNLAPPLGWQVITGAGCPPTNPQSVLLNSPSFTALPFYIWQGALAWFQTQGGDVHAQQEITSRIPSTASDTNFSVVQDNYPGVVSFGGSQANFGLQGGTVSTEGWLTNSYFYPSKSDYNYFYQKLGSPTTDNFSCESAPCPDPPSGATTLPSGALLYYSANNVSINQNSWQISPNTKVIVLVNGDLNISLNPINGRIVVPPGSFLAFIVKGNINIDGNIGNKQTDLTPFLQGVYLADGVIDTYQPDPVGLGSGFRFIGAGVFYAKGGVRLDRDVKEDPSEAIQNSTTPSELFTFRPDLIINAPAEILSSKLSWVEIVP